MARTPGQGSSSYVSFNYGFMAPHEERCGELWCFHDTCRSPRRFSSVGVGRNGPGAHECFGECETGPEDGQGGYADDPSPLREQRAGTFGSDEWYGVTNAGCRMDISP